MTSHEPIQFKLTEGIDAYNPDVVADVLVFFHLNNVEPRLGRLFASRGYEIFQDLELESGDKITSFGFYQLANRVFNNLYAFSRTSVYWFNFETELFEATPVYTGFFASDDPYVLLQWFDALYVTKLYSPYVRLQRKIATEIAGAPFGRYGIIANSHAYLGAVGSAFDTDLALLRWSDLDDPESWTVSPNDSEADFFNLEPDNRQITGLSFQRGSPLVYSENSIWIGKSIGFPGGFHHEPLFPGLGNIFHDAVVRGKEIDYFIGADDIYALNGLQVVPIGEKIFSRFISSIKIDSNTRVRGYLDSRKDQVFWIYTNTSDERASIVYNYREQKWSERDPQDLHGWLDTPRVAMRGYLVIDDVDDIIDEDENLIDDPNDGFPVVLPQLGGTEAAGLVSSGESALIDDGGDPFVTDEGDAIVISEESEVEPETAAAIIQATDQFLKVDGDAFAHVLESADFFFKNIGQMNEITKALLEYVGDGEANIQISIGVRGNQSQDIVWSTAKDIDRTTDSSLSFFLRQQGVGKYIRFRLTWGNTDDDNVVDLRLLSLVKVEQSNDTPEE